MVTHGSVRIEFESARAVRAAGFGGSHTGSSPKGKPDAVPFPVALPVAGRLELKAAYLTLSEMAHAPLTGSARGSPACGGAARPDHDSLTSMRSLA